MNDKKQIFQKERKIFLNCMNSWFSNFIIEEFRTDYLPDAKIKNIFMGTVDLSGHPLPKLFEPKEISIEIGYNYNQEIFNNDILIYNLDDSNLAEVEFVIRGLKNIKYENEKTLILVSNIMTWAKTPLKVFTDEQRNAENFNEEEVPDIKEEIPIKKVEKKVVFEEKKEKPVEEDKKSIKSKGSKGSKKSKSSSSKDKDKGKQTQKKKKTTKKTSLKKDKKEEEKKTEEKKLEEERVSTPGSNSVPRENLQTPPLEEVKKEPELPKIKTYYYKESEYSKRVPNSKYFQYKVLENYALSNTNPMLKVYVVCPGFIYGCGEDFFFDYFRMSWIGGIQNIPIIGDGKNFLPTIHILDLVQVIRRIIERKPIINYIFAIDRTKNPTMKNILRKIGSGIGSLDVNILKDFNIDEVNIPNFNELNIDVRIKPSEILSDENRREGEDVEDYQKRLFPWHCEFGIPENILKLSEEFNLYRGLKPIKIVITGPPLGGKSTIASSIAKKFKITHLTIPDICEWAKTLDSPLGEETREKLREMNEIIEKAQDEYEHRKNKKKTDPPFDPSPLKKFTSEFLGKLLREKLGNGECSGKGYVLDNYPKSYEDCMNIFSVNNEIKHNLLPDNVIIIDNYTDDSLKNKLQKKEEYLDKQVEMDLRFNRRLETYKNINTINEENQKLLRQFYEENNIEILFVNETNFMMNKHEEDDRIIEYLERNGPIDNYSKLQDETEIITFKEPDDIDNNDEEKILMQNDDEENKENISKEKSSINFDIKNNIKERKIEDDLNSTENNLGLENDKNLDNGNNSQDKKNNNEGNDDNLKREVKKISTADIIKKQEIHEKNIQSKLNELREREKSLLEKKSEVLRRYLSENVMPLLAKGILHVCHNMPEDPVEALANFLLDNSFAANKEIKDNIINNDLVNIVDASEN